MLDIAEMYSKCNYSFAFRHEASFLWHRQSKHSAFFKCAFYMVRFFFVYAMSKYWQKQMYKQPWSIISSVFISMNANGSGTKTIIRDFVVKSLSNNEPISQLLNLSPFDWNCECKWNVSVCRHLDCANFWFFFLQEKSNESLYIHIHIHSYIKMSSKKDLLFRFVKRFQHDFSPLYECMC